MFELVSPAKTLVQFEKRTEFCFDNRLDFLSISKVLRGDIGSYQGWQLENRSKPYKLHRERKRFSWEKVK
jgi:hypothetical protein